MAARLIGQMIVHYAEFMVKRVHQVEQHKSNVQGIEIIALLSDHHFPRHSHDQFAVGVMAFGGHRSWSSIGTVQSSAGDMITANPGEMHDGIPLEGNAREWRMIYFDPGLVRRETEEEITARHTETPTLEVNGLERFANQRRGRPAGLPLPYTQL